MLSYLSDLSETTPVRLAGYVPVAKGFQLMGGDVSIGSPALDECARKPSLALGGGLAVQIGYS